jgi:hypothetical protein
MSEDGGESWTDPERFTPVTNPPLDWRWVSIAPVNPVSGTSTKVHLVMVGDIVAGQFIPGPWNFPLAKFYHFSTEITLTDVEEEPELVNTFNLSQNYPNPFNPSTSIEYRVGSKEYITLKIYDILGREVAILVNEEKPAGSYEIKFDASSLASGVYFYKLQTESIFSSKKMVLLK